MLTEALGAKTLEGPFLSSCAISLAQNINQLPALCVMREGSRGGKYPAETWWLLHKICKQQPEAEAHLVTASVCILTPNECENNINLQSAVGI